MNGGRICDAGCRDGVYLQHGIHGIQHVHDLFSLLAAVDQDEVANCRYVERLDLHIVNLLGEAWVTSQDIATLVSDWQGMDFLAPMLARKEVQLDIMMVSSLTQRMEEGVKGVSSSREVDQLMLLKRNVAP